jgi:hypothetical protein
LIRVQICSLSAVQFSLENASSSAPPKSWVLQRPVILRKQHKP